VSDLFVNTVGTVCQIMCTEHVIISLAIALPKINLSEYTVYCNPCLCATCVCYICMSLVIIISAFVNCVIGLRALTFYNKYQYLYQLQTYVDHSQSTQAKATVHSVLIELCIDSKCKGKVYWATPLDHRQGADLPIVGGWARSWTPDLVTFPAYAITKMALPVLTCTISEG